MLLSKGGESIKGVSLMDRELIEHGARVAEAVGVKGPANVQCFREPDGSLPITDVNTRFGGGFPLPLAAGGRYPELALALARGERPEPRLGDFVEGVAMTRYFSEVCLAPDGEGTLRPIPAAELSSAQLESRQREDSARAKSPEAQGASRLRCSRSSVVRSIPGPCATSSPAQPASSGRSSCGRSSNAATTRPASDAFTDYYDPALKEENARDLPVARATSWRIGSSSTGSTASSTSPDSRASRASAACSRSTFARTCSRASGCSRQPPRRASAPVFASSSSIYGDAAAYPTPEDTIPRPMSPYGDARSSRASTSPERTDRSSASRS